MKKICAVLLVFITLTILTATYAESGIYHTGDYVYLGKYEQDGNEANGKEPIQWLVLEEKDGNLLLLSVKGLERHRFHVRSNGEMWIGSELREWLNNSFLLTSFTPDESDSILLTSVEDDKNQTDSKWNTAGRLGGTTQDKIFLLSYQEMLNLTTPDQRLCQPSDYLYAKGVSTVRKDSIPYCWYWLRTSAFRNNAVVVSEKGAFETCYIHHDYGVVRPALWVEASAVTQ